MAASLLALLMMAAPPENRLATPARPALVRPVIEAAARCSGNPQLVVALTGFTPPRAGHASILVSLRTSDGRTSRLGEVGIFPQQAFSVPLSGAKRFGFAVPKRSLALNPRVLVELRSEGGDGGARAVVGEARIGPAPQERC